MSLYKVGLHAQSLFYVLAGVNHFWHQAFYLQIMPDHYWHPAGLVQVTGGAEILGGLGLLVSPTRPFSAVGIASMLVVYFDVHQFMLRHSERFPYVPKWILWGRLPLQLVLIAWALAYARRSRLATESSR